jgi:hypothetical protein
MLLLPLLLLLLLEMLLPDTAAHAQAALRQGHLRRVIYCVYLPQTSC